MTTDGGALIPVAMVDELWTLYDQGNPFRQPMSEQEKAELDAWWVAYNRPHRRVLRWLGGGWKNTLHARLFPDHEDYD